MPSVSTFRRASPRGDDDDARSANIIASNGVGSSTAIDRAIERARVRARDAERALQRKVTRSMRDLTNRGVERDATRDGMRTDAAARGSKDGDARRGDDDDDANGATRPRDGRTSEARDATHGPRATVGRERGMGRETMTWMEDAVARAVREAERAEREGGRTMRARAASTVAAVMRSGVKNSNGGRRERSEGGVVASGDREMMDASPSGSAREGKVSPSSSSPRYRRSDVEAIEATLRTDFENALKLMRERAEAAEREVGALTAKCQELDNGRKSARNALAEMASQNAKLVSAFASKKDEVRALKESVEVTASQADLKAENAELRDALAGARAEARKAREIEAIRKKELSATRSELDALRSRVNSNNSDSSALSAKLAAVMKELEREREAFALHKASWKQERAKLVRFATDASPRKASSPRRASSPETKATTTPSKASPPKRETPQKAKPSPRRQRTPTRPSPKKRLSALREQAEQLKVRGNQNFHAKAYDAALQAYADALAIDFDDQAFRAVLHANKAAALQAMGKFCDAVMECCVSRTFDDTYIRALQRRADAYLSMGDWPMAMKDLEELAPHMGDDCAMKLREAQRKVKNGATSCEHYAVLGVSSRATKADVSKAYKSLALKFHPDKAPSDAVRPASEALFKRVAEAYAVLKDASKRASYDATRIRRTHSI